jgi:hypothetical protein
VALAPLDLKAFLGHKARKVFRVPRDRLAFRDRKAFMVPKVPKAPKEPKVVSVPQAQPRARPDHRVLPARDSVHWAFLTPMRDHKAHSLV